MRRAFLLFIFSLISASIYADTLIIEPEMGREPVLKLLREAKRSIHLSMYGFTDEKLRRALLQQKQNGIDIKVILEKSPYKNENENHATIRHLRKGNVSLRGKPKNVRLMHAKLLLIDKQQALLMTFNFTHSAFQQQRNFGLLINDPKKVKALENIFNSDWHNRSIYIEDENIILSPINSRVTMINLLHSANQRIDIYAQDLSDENIIQTLIHKAKHNINVHILTTNKMAKRGARRLISAGIHVKENTHHYVHAKIIIIDGEKALIGSINLTRPSLDDNRELSVITHDAAIVKALNNIFSKDWQQETAIHNRVNWLYDRMTRRKAWQMLKTIGS